MKLGKIGVLGLAIAIIILALGRLALSLAYAYWIIKKANHDFNNRD